jgi:hypothetical protein
LGADADVGSAVAGREEVLVVVVVVVVVVLTVLKVPRCQCKDSSAELL